MNAAPDTFSLQAAEAFVSAHGTPLERATWKAGFGCGPVEVLVFELEPHLDGQGVWTGLAPGEGPGGLASALNALRLLSTVNLGEDIFEVGARTIAQLRHRRSADGSWDAPGPWPGQGEGRPRRAWYTAAIGALVTGLTGSADAAESVAMRDGAARWLLDHHARLPDPGPATSWATLACLGDLAATDPTAARVAAEMEARLMRWVSRPRPASDLAWIHEAARRTGRSEGVTLRRATWEGLAASQFVTGGWGQGSEAGWPVSAVEATYHACRVLVRP